MEKLKINKKDISILIVDDEAANILLLTKILSMDGYNNIVTTTSPLEASDLYKRNNFELIILDINMPEMSGYEVLKDLQGLTGFDKTKVIASSGDISTNDVNKALEAGFSDYITKPMRMQNILNLMDKVLMDNTDV